MRADLRSAQIAWQIANLFAKRGQEIPIEKFLLYHSSAQRPSAEDIERRLMAYLGGIARRKDRRGR